MGEAYKFATLGVTVGLIMFIVMRPQNSVAVLTGVATAWKDLVRAVSGPIGTPTPQ